MTSAPVPALSREDREGMRRGHQHGHILMIPFAPLSPHDGSITTHSSSRTRMRPSASLSTRATMSLVRLAWTMCMHNSSTCASLVGHTVLSQLARLAPAPFTMVTTLHRSALATACHLPWFPRARPLPLQAALSRIWFILCFTCALTAQSAYGLLVFRGCKTPRR